MINLANFLTINNDNIAIIDENNSYSYNNIHEKSNSLASGLLKFGVKKYDKVGIKFFNSFEFLISYLAVLKVGATAVLINPIRTASSRCPASRSRTFATRPVPGTASPEASSVTWTGLVERRTRPTSGWRWGTERCSPPSTSRSSVASGCPNSNATRSRRGWPPSSATPTKLVRAAAKKATAVVTAPVRIPGPTLPLVSSRADSQPRPRRRNSRYRPT